jgi:hypothetical protein
MGTGNRDNLQQYHDVRLYYYINQQMENFQGNQYLTNIPKGQKTIYTYIYIYIHTHTHTHT